ncbi:phosphoribosylglycinamide formyltransferase [Candidatus Desulfovibrio trichonymphae]|uniref:Phosphoribosylglycinamide formyltransferase n=1 Tax=Candidatus Desulfovibrio trichonymphae TaxID=1725232 RepID=A0A1J1E2F1_9BACT|nr:phosphoribosylglycinamide formyltransferase [Candidatus Desulfovibrio trichonymphae]GHT14768.1 phosphoribosylglycinamide formyltransferase [Endomicrobiia bacterium]GHU92436.1 phosphoribosylglycinamide formyltransferase [Deltaproteobacteria bacterium]BAV92043.1 phosphoribosylglycinamide formyltransferase [Candidatus Desulfovibrio trichonymphae]GHU94491.1 phosphoribosylglycinamide formyltransferase [Deltaproteobacteria bacterium]GHU98486.1 phosphoribosylglycinamide formyltransferase [Deltapro
MPLNIAILASGNGSNAQAMMDKAAAGTLDVNIRLVVSNRQGAGVLDRARKVGLPHLVLDHTAWSDRAAYDGALAEVLRKSGAEVIALAGYMRLLSPCFLKAFEGRVINIHPALLPSFAGLHGGADALAYGVSISGCTVHFVEEQMDSGPVIIQAAVPVNAGEDIECLMERLHAMEHRIYPQALQWLAQGRITRAGRQVFLAPGNERRVRSDGDWFVWPPLEENF